MSQLPYDALLVLSFGGPEKPDDVIPFLENVLRGRNVPRERMLEVAEHYYHYGGQSPINDQNRQLMQCLKRELEIQQIDLPIYWGNRNWHPMLAETMRKMEEDGIERVLVFVTSIFSSYSGCRQYREDIQRAQAELGLESMVFHKIRTFYNHPLFVETMVDHVQSSTKSIEASNPIFLFTAHSIPNAMAANCAYERQLTESCRLISEAAGCENWKLVYQSRSGPPQQPWLEPDICDEIEKIAGEESADHVVVIPVGFVSDHMEVIYDLDDEAKTAAQNASLGFTRVPTAGVHPKFIQMICKLIEERIGKTDEKQAIGKYGPSHDTCPVDCCKYEPRKPQKPTN